MGFEEEVLTACLEIFLPSYVDHDTIDLERKPDPVEDIILTDEEAAAILPQ